MPKFPVAAANIRFAGMRGDFNRYRHEKAHDKPEWALLLLPLETIQQLNREGWPIKPGDLGENITTQGIAYEEFSAEKRCRVGTSVIRISEPCTPCANLYLLPYVGASQGPEFLRTLLNRRGWYAQVLKEGAARTGDAIEIVEDDAVG